MASRTGRGTPDAKRLHIFKQIVDDWAEKLIAKKEAVAAQGISPETFYDWLEKLKGAREYYDKKAASRDKLFRREANHAAMDSLMKKIEGYEFENQEVEGHYTTDEQGNRTFVVSKVKKKKVHVQPSDTSIIFALTNTDPENWKNRHNQEIEAKIEDTTIDWESLPLEKRKQIAKMLKEKQK